MSEVFAPNIFAADWYTEMSRKNIHFNAWAFTLAELEYLSQIVGDMNHWAYVLDNEEITIFRSKKEQLHNQLVFQNLVLKRDAQLVEWGKQAYVINEKALGYIQSFKARAGSGDLPEFREFFEVYKDSLFFGVVVVWYILLALDSLEEELGGDEFFENLKKRYEPLRMVSIYPQMDLECLDFYYNDVCKKHDIALFLAKYITPEELLYYYDSGVLTVAQRELIRRKQSLAIFNSDMGKHVFTYDIEMLKGFNDRYDPIVELGDGVLIGTVACTGFAKGIVRIVREVADIPKMQKGDVLVSDATNPSLMPAIHLASAIVTNEGGVTCHAAIVSRELGIPCVIGVIAATKKLQDGDFIEVDASKGVVRFEPNPSFKTHPLVKSDTLTMYYETTNIYPKTKSNYCIRTITVT